MKILINGINGKMGQEVANVLDNDKDIVLVGGVDKENTGIYTYPQRLLLQAGCRAQSMLHKA